MSAHDFQSLRNHVGHPVEVVTYGQNDHVSNVAVECLDCNEVLLDFDNPDDLNKSEDGDIEKILRVARLALHRDEVCADVVQFLNMSEDELGRIMRKIDQSLEALSVPQG